MDKHCDKSKDPFRPTTDELIVFLTSLYNQGKGYSCINLARSAVATLLFGSKISVGMLPLVKNLLEECLTEDQHSHGTQLRGTHILCLIF